MPSEPVDESGRVDETGRREREDRQIRQQRLNKAVRFYRIALRISLTIIFLAFVKSILSKLPPPTITGQASFVILKGALVAYLYCWFFGCNHDLTVENDVLTDAPEPGKKEIGFIIVL